MDGLNVIPEQSVKLKEICSLLADNLIPFYSKFCSSYNARYRYHISIMQHDTMYRFPVFLAETPMTSLFQTAITDEETQEVVAVPINGLVQLRVKGPRAGSAVQGWIKSGSIEVSDIRRISINRPVPNPMSATLVMPCYLDQNDIRKSISANKRK